MTTTTHDVKKAVSVIGLGMMGATLARLLLAQGYRVTVWNRSASKTEALVKEGAVSAPDVVTAINASPVAVVCVLDYKTTLEILSPAAVKAALAGRTLVQLSSGSPVEAEESEALLHSLGGSYLDGAIQAAPAQMGQEDTPILVSGRKDVYDRYEPVLRVFGGRLSYLGEKAGLASAVDLATLSYIYGASLGFFHGARIIESAGLPVSDYGALVAGISPTFGHFLQHEGNVVHSGDFSISASPLNISVDATARIWQHAKEAGINDEFPRFAADLFRRADAAGYGREEVAAMIKLLRA